jgi:hypothetical protein
MKNIAFKFNNKKTIKANSQSIGVSEIGIKKFMSKNKISGRENNFKRRIRELIQSIEELEKDGIKPTINNLCQKLKWSNNTVLKYKNIIEESAKRDTKLVYNFALRQNMVLKSYSFNQNEILHNIMLLHNNGNGFHLDVTYSLGKFYEQSKKYYVPQPKIKMDAYPHPLMNNVIEIKALEKWNIEDNTIPSVVIDLPFIISPLDAPSTKVNNKNSNMIQTRFSSYQDRNSLCKSYYHFISEAYRVLEYNGICVMKCQATVSCSTQLFIPEYCWMVAQECGFYVLDQMFLISEKRMHSSKQNHQQHFRKHTATFYIFKKTKKKVDYFSWK